MKFRMLPILALMPLLSYSAELDTIKVNPDFAATLEFRDTIDYLLIGNNPVVKMLEDGSTVNKYYEVFSKNNVAVLRSYNATAPTTSLTIGLTNGQLFTGYLMYSPQVKKSYYRFKAPNARTEKETADSIEALQKKAGIDGNMKRILAEPQEIEDIAEIKNSEVYQVTNVANDDRYTYIKILIANNSASNYIVNDVMFKYREGKKRKLNKKEVYNENWMKTEGFIFPKANEVRAKTSGYIVFAIPLYTTESGFLIIKIMEKSGSRTSDIEISAKELAYIKYYK